MVNINLSNQSTGPVARPQTAEPMMRRPEMRKPAEDMSGKKGGNVGKIIIVILLLAALAGGGFWFVKKQTPNRVSVADSSKFQAVFLANGQTYFGKVANEYEQYVTLTNVFYLVLKQPLQNQNEGEAANPDQAKVQPEYSVVKLGKELHGPTSMAINRDQILFIENLSDDSKVVSAIKQSK